MGDIVRKVAVCGIQAGRRTACQTFDALIDTGARRTSITRAVATAVKASILLKMFRTPPPYGSGEEYDGAEVEFQLLIKDCKPLRQPAVIDEATAKRAGYPVVLGHDYLQEFRGALKFGKGSEHDQVACAVTGLTKRKRKLQ